MQDRGCRAADPDRPTLARRSIETGPTAGSRRSGGPPRRRFLDPDDILMRGCPIRSAALVPQNIGRAVRPLSGDLRIQRRGRRPRYAMWAMNAPVFHESYVRLESGTTRKRISREHLAALRDTCPAPRRAAAHRRVLEDHLSRLDAAERGLSCQREARCALVQRSGDDPSLLVGCASQGVRTDCIHSARGRCSTRRNSLVFLCPTCETSTCVGVLSTLRIFRPPFLNLERSPSSRSEMVTSSRAKAASQGAVPSGVATGQGLHSKRRCIESVSTRWQKCSLSLWPRCSKNLCAQAGRIGSSPEPRSSTCRKRSCDASRSRCRPCMTRKPHSNGWRKSRRRASGSGLRYPRPLSDAKHCAGQCLALRSLVA